jgi:hypothetical protein
LVVVVEEQKCFCYIGSRTLARSTPLAWPGLAKHVRGEQGLGRQHCYGSYVGQDSRNCMIRLGYLVEDFQRRVS